MKPRIGDRVRLIAHDFEGKHNLTKNLAINGVYTIMEISKGDFLYIRLKEDINGELLKMSCFELCRKEIRKYGIVKFWKKYGI